MAFHFPVMPRMYMAVARENATPIIDIMQRTPPIPPQCQWAIFLRNHDELTLEMVTEDERKFMYEYYAKDPRMRVNVGIRRRLAPLMDNGRDQMELMSALLMSLPGSPVLYYGDELGMGDNVYLGDRNGVRTPMQWSGDRNAGFSNADTAALYFPVIVDAPYGYQTINVEAQERTQSSLLQWTRAIVRLRRRYRAFGRGTFEPLPGNNRRILAFLRRYGEEIILCVNNLARHAQFVQLDLGAFKGWTPIELWSGQPFPAIRDEPYLLTLSGREFFWFKLVSESNPERLGAVSEVGA
jgi:maltose alpha-D-glucosyltransferase/alpha-amylase